MNTRQTLIAVRTGWAACAVSLVMATSAAFAVEAPPPAPPAPSKEMREKMATLHEQMATCLRSDEAVDACHEEMMKACHATMGTDGCPMMKMHHRPMKDHAMGTANPK